MAARSISQPMEMALKGNILIVDDVQANLVLLSNMLKEQGYKVRSVVNGKMAIMTTKAAPPDLILLDITMPGMDGYEVCEHLKADEQTADIPILFISALDKTQGKVRAFAAGGVDYITKPFQIEEVLARVETHLALRRLQKQLEETNDELAQRLQELEQANAELKASNAELDAFAHTVAHDLKNPLGGMIGYAELLLSRCADQVDKSSYEVMDALVKAGWRMSNIIKELLLLARLRGEELKVRPLYMDSVVKEAKQRLSFMIEQYDAQIVAPDTWPVAMGYAPWVEEVWANYISNALKYGGQPPRVELGATEITATGGSAADGPGWVRFWVRDNGGGLSPEEQARLFVPFTQIHQVRAQGHGLGLSIVHRIVQKLGGEVGVESQVGQGSEFFFVLPAAPVSPAEDSA